MTHAAPTPDDSPRAAQGSSLAPALPVIHLGRMGYDDAYQQQLLHHEEVLASRGAAGAPPGCILVVEHDPVVTVTRRAGASGHVLATPEALARAGVALRETDRGGDVTYHGPGQLVLYPILDLDTLRLGLHDHMRLLEESIIQTLAPLGIPARRDPGATGVWVEHQGTLAKVAACGVRVRRWVTMHGLALNIAPDLAHFNLIVPCGLAGRPVTSVRAILGDRCPDFVWFARNLPETLSRLVASARRPDAAK